MTVNSATAFAPASVGNVAVGFDVLGHSFLRYAQPEQFGNVTAAESRRYGKVLDRYTGWVANQRHFEAHRNNGGMGVTYRF